MDRLWARLGIAGAMGVLAAATSLSLDMPGDGSWIVACLVAGGAAAVAAPSWKGYVAAVGGILLVVMAAVASGVQYPGLSWFVASILAVVLGNSFLVVAMLVRARRISTFADRQVLVGLSAALALALLLAAVAQSLASNPP